MLRWNWFLSADFQGKWITTQGYANVRLGRDVLEASLRFSADDEEYHHVAGRMGPDDAVEATVTSSGRGLVPFGLHGQLFRGGVVEGVETMTLILTDGTTVLGLAYGPRSHESNL
jgi:hypothetical protein